MLGFFLDSINSGTKMMFLVLAMGGKYSDDFYNGNHSTHNQSLSHMFSFGSQSTVLCPYQLHLMYFIYSYLPFLIQELWPSPGFCTAPFTDCSYISRTYHHSSLSSDPQRRAKTTATKCIYFCLETKD